MIYHLFTSIQALWPFYFSFCLQKFSKINKCTQPLFRSLEYLKLLPGLAGRPECQGGQIGWGARLDYSMYLILHLVKNSSKDQNPKKWRNQRNFEKTRQTERKKSKLRAWLGARLAGGQIGWEARLAGRPDWIIPYPSLSQ